MIGFFTGSFDPIHLGHINFALQMKEKANLEKVIFCLSYISVFKQNLAPLAQAQDRLNMLKLAIKDIKGFEFYEKELQSKKLCFTIDTIKSLKTKVRLLLTEEALDDFHLWKDYKDLLQMAPPIIGTRKVFLKKFQNKFLSLSEKSFIKTDIFEISSTQIRERVKSKLYVGHMLLKEVVDYIYNHKIYF